MIDSYLRTTYQSYLVDPLLPILVKWKFSPHAYTWGSLFCGLAVIPWITLGSPWMAIFFLVLSGYLDTLDGSIARATQQTSPQGAVFDIFADRLVETAIILGLYLVDPVQRGLPSLLMLGSAFLCVTSFLAVGIFLRNESYKGFYYSPGLMERTEAFLFFGAMILFPSVFTILALLFSTLVFATALIRIWQFIPN